jgi:hypothetical protein
MIASQSFFSKVESNVLLPGLRRARRPTGPPRDTHLIFRKAFAGSDQGRNCTPVFCEDGNGRIARALAEKALAQHLGQASLNA